MRPFSVNEVKGIRTTPCRTPKQWDEHLKKQRDAVKKYVNLEKLPKVVQVRPALYLAQECGCLNRRNVALRGLAEG